MQINRQQLTYSNFLYLFLLLLLSSCAATSQTQQSTAHQHKIALSDDAGMWLMPQLEGPLLTAMETRGLTLTADSLYSVTGPALNQAVTRININQNLAGSGSFVSPNGLILTNYGVAYNGIVGTADSLQNVFKEGFYADSKSAEIPLPNYTIYIPVEQKEVTDQINRNLPDTLTYRQRRLKSQEVRQKLISQRKAENSNLIVEIDDYWGGNRQFMSVYKVIRDVRLVHAPPEAVATDNPSQDRASYAFLRAYSDNVPFSPAKYLDISTDEISVGDLTMVMGFPGETSRHASSYALQFYSDYRNPVIMDSYRAILDGLQYTANGDSATALQNAAQRASLKNTLSYFESLQGGVRNRHIISRKQQLEQNFKQWVSQDSLRQIRYRRVLDQLDQAYSIASQTGDLLHATVYTINNVRLFQVAALYESHRDLLEDPSQKQIPQSYRDSLLTRHKKLLNSVDVEAQQITLSQMLYMLSTLPDGKVPFYLIDLFGDTQGDELRIKIGDYLQRQRQESIIYNLDRAQNFLDLPIDSARQQPTDEFIRLYRALLESYQFSKKNYVQYTAYQQPAFKRYMQGMLEFKPKHFQFPDANGTLRLSIGQINNDPADNRRTANIFTTNDVTGGNAGSPLLNSRGMLIGITRDNTARNASGDYQYNPDTKTLSTGIKSIISVMNELNATGLLEEISSRE